MTAAFVMIAQAAAAQPATDTVSTTGASAPIARQARASARILRPVSLRVEDGEIAQRQDFVPPQRSTGDNGQIWFEFS